MEHFIYNIIVVALIAAFVLTLLRKWGGIEWVQIHGNDFFSKMFNCDFCLSWWTCVLICFFALIFTGNPAFLGVPFCSTMITRILL